MFAGQTSSAALSLITTLLLTRYLGPEQFGLFATALSLAILLTPLSDLGFDLHMIRMISTKSDSLTTELSQTFSTRILLSLSVWILMIISAVALRYSADLIMYVALVGIASTITSLATNFNSAIRALRKMKYESISLFVGRIITLALVIIMISAKAALAEILIAFIAGSIIIFSMAFYFLKHNIEGLKISFDLSGFRNRLKGALPFGLTAILTAIYFKADTIILSKSVPAEQVGFYNVAQNFVMAAMIISSAITVAIFPALAAAYEKNKDEARQLFNRGLTILISVGLPLGIGTILISDNLIHLLFGAAFAQSAILLALISMKIPFVFATSLIGNSMGAVGFQKKVVFISLINCVFSLIMNFIFIPRYGAKAAAIITTMTEFIGLLQLIYISHPIFRFSILSDIAKILVCSIAGIIIFVLVSPALGAWPALIAFTLGYTGLAFGMRLVSIDMIKGLLMQRSLS